MPDEDTIRRFRRHVQKRFFPSLKDSNTPTFCFGPQNKNNEKNVFIPTGLKRHRRFFLFYFRNLTQRDVVCRGMSFTQRKFTSDTPISGVFQYGREMLGHVGDMKITPFWPKLWSNIIQLTIQVCTHDKTELIRRGLLGGSSQLVSSQQLWLVSPLTGVVPLPNGLNGL